MRDHYDSEAEEAIDWYQHYMSVAIEDLALEYLSRRSGDSKPRVETLNDTQEIDFSFSLECEEYE